MSTASILWLVFRTLLRAESRWCA